MDIKGHGACLHVQNLYYVSPCFKQVNHSVINQQPLFYYTDGQILQILYTTKAN